MKNNNKKNKDDYNYNLITIILAIIVVVLLLLTCAIDVMHNNMIRKEYKKNEVKQTKNYSFNNGMELTTMEVKDEIISLSPMSTRSRKLYSKCPMSNSYQKWLDKKCKKYGISTNVVLGVMEVESNFKVKAIGDRGRSLGLMQVQKRYHTKRMRKLGAKNLLNAYDNATVGVDYLSELYKYNGRNWHKTLMAYNGGQYYANRNVKRGIYSTSYSRTVMHKAYKFKANRK